MQSLLQMKRKTVQDNCAIPSGACPLQRLQKSGAWHWIEYAHDYPNHYRIQYLPDEIKNARFYEPGDLGYEKQIK